MCWLFPYTPRRRQEHKSKKKLKRTEEDNLWLKKSLVDESLEAKALPKVEHTGCVITDICP